MKVCSKCNNEFGDGSECGNCGIDMKTVFAEHFFEDKLIMPPREVISSKKAYVDQYLRTTFQVRDWDYLEKMMLVFTDATGEYQINIKYWQETKTGKLRLGTRLIKPCKHLMRVKILNDKLDTWSYGKVWYDGGMMNFYCSLSDGIFLSSDYSEVMNYDYADDLGAYFYMLQNNLLSDYCGMVFVGREEDNTPHSSSTMYHVNLIKATYIPGG